MGKSTISMAIFNCYVSSPEGIHGNLPENIHVEPQSCFDEDQLPNPLGP